MSPDAGLCGRCPKRSANPLGCSIRWHVMPPHLSSGTEALMDLQGLPLCTSLGSTVLRDWLYRRQPFLGADSLFFLAGMVRASGR
jgi:hypothetical protein